MGNLNQPPEEWLRELFEYEFCAECGGDWFDHEAIPFLGNWFARCLESIEPGVPEFVEEAS